VTRRFVFEKTTFIDAPLADVFEFFSAPQNLGRITPPEMRFRILEGPNRRLRQDDRITYSMRIWGVPVRWRTHITLWREGEAFADLQERGPYRHWLHTHTFREKDGRVEMHDRVEYELPFGALGAIFGGWMVRRQIEAIFSFREKVIHEVFAR
jgi:ligand-binding SRPBCC domain-containing protein